jgi:hypothetical protein
VCKGFNAPDPAREPLSVLLDTKWHGGPLNPVLCGNQFNGAAKRTVIFSRKPLSVRAQGIGGVRSSP